MTIVAGQSVEKYFGSLPETFIWSDQISHNGIRLLAVLYARWTREFWPIVTNKELAEWTNLSVATIKREVSALQELGLIKVIRTRGGNQYELIRVEFEDDTYRGRYKDKVSRKAWAKVFISLTASPISSGALRLWLMLDRIGRDYEWIISSQSALAKYLGVKDRQIRVYLDELKEAGVLESRRRNPLDKNEYRLIRTPVMIKVAEEHDERQELRKATNRVGRSWLLAVVGDDLQKWIAENDELTSAVTTYVSRVD
ncbi:helix-turn-helix domain-containing protein [Streptosporangium sp. G11]|uniref:helix-turn-helix domain-containing protein n=1 Tax=Streptosporangium sp. G11 TaxID=3436926 RepID=UPI003EC0B2E2